MVNILDRKMSKQLQILLFLIIGCNVLSYAQSPFCGTPDLESIKDQMIKNREDVPRIKTRNATTYLPLKVHIVGDSEGNGKIDESDILVMLCDLNENFAALEIQFYFKDGFNYINNSFIYNNQDPNNSIFRSEIRSIKNKHNAVNIFFKGSVAESGVLAYYLPSPGLNDFIVVKNSTAKNRRVVTHEVGHFFNLPHPFHGWDNDPWDPSIHGNPVGNLAPNNVTINEYADGSNCDESVSPNQNNVGDGICDTPADYNFISNSCDYKNNAMDPTGNPVSPQTNNWMNYFEGCDNFQFTNGQIEEMKRSLQSPGRAYIFSNYSPNINNIEDVPQLIAPIKSQEVGETSEVELSWDLVPNADWYLVEIDRTPTLSFDVRSLITNDSKILISNLDIDRNYFWRVTPFNEYYTCASGSDIERFKTSISTSVDQIDAIEELNVYPTILVGNKILNIELNALESFDAKVSIYNFTGQSLVSPQTWFIRNGINRKKLDLSNQPNGIYLVNINTIQGNVAKKIIIQ